MKLSGSDIWKYFTYTGANGMGALTAGTGTPKLYYSGGFEYRFVKSRPRPDTWRTVCFTRVDRSAARQFGRTESVIFPTPQDGEELC